ncbi:alanine racemase [Maricaulis sp.]|uniref:alanine racemase n=1 Tax=Maricaulis sp. TaxID=1486257 RepID=UPI002630EC38|nr:alanine racemase [Maricaulis sp.]
MKTALTNIAPAPRLVVDLDIIRTNYRHLQALTPGAETAAVVKANAYGLGAEQVVPALADAGCRQFFVAHTSEGLEARQALGDRPGEVFVFNGFWPAETDTLHTAGLIPVINDLGQLQQLREHAPDLPCAIHFDTGMNRLGLDERETQRVLDEGLLDRLQVRQIMSHLACADEADHALNRQQLERFKAISGALPDIPASFANSAGVLLGPDYQFDVTRPGLALYAGAPAPGTGFDVCVRIEAPVLQVRMLQPGDSVGYGATWTADRPIRTATIAAGYADGILRACGEGGIARLNGQLVPILGRVSMDLISVDLSDFQGEVHPGDYVHVLGADLDALSEHAGTISYELLVRLGLRFNRVYKG